MIAAEQRIGELLLAIPKQAGRPSENSSTHVEKLKTKSEVASDMGYSKDDVSDYQQMAKNPDLENRDASNFKTKSEAITDQGRHAKGTFLHLFIYGVGGVSLLHSFIKTLLNPFKE